MRTEYLYIGRCKAKGCKTTVRVTVPAVHIKYSRNVNYFPGCNNPAIYQEFTKTTPEWSPYARLGLSCVAHKWPLAYQEVNGTLNPEHKCDSRCTGAKGPNCDCSCGGANHGKAYSI